MLGEFLLDYFCRIGIMGRELVGPFRVADGVKMTSAKSVDLTTFFRGTKRRTVLSIAKSSHAKNTSVSLTAMGING